jgi:hypothetical protein
VEHVDDPHHGATRAICPRSCQDKTSDTGSFSPQNAPVLLACDHVPRPNEKAASRPPRRRAPYPRVSPVSNRSERLLPPTPLTTTNAAPAFSPRLVRGPRQAPRRGRRRAACCCPFYLDRPRLDLVRPSLAPPSVQPRRDGPMSGCVSQEFPRACPPSPGTAATVVTTMRKGARPPVRTLLDRSTSRRSLLDGWRLASAACLRVESSLQQPQQSPPLRRGRATATPKDRTGRYDDGGGGRSKQSCCCWLLLQKG